MHWLSTIRLHCRVWTLPCMYFEGTTIISEVISLFYHSLCNSKLCFSVWRIQFQNLHIRSCTYWFGIVFVLNIIECLTPVMFWAALCVHICETFICAVCGSEVPIISVLGVVFMFVIQLMASWNLYMWPCGLDMTLDSRFEGSEFGARTDLWAGFSAHRWHCHLNQR